MEPAESEQKQILIVEDDGNLAKAMRLRLEAAGYSVRTATNGVAGMYLAEADPPDLILADILMPIGAGFALAYRLRQAAFRVPIIFVTGSKNPQLRQAAEEYGVAVIEKPYEPATLLEVVARALDPAAVAARLAAATQSLPAAKAGNQILVVEDDEKIALSLSIRLRAAKYEVTLAYDAISGVNAATKYQPDLILLDITMPGGSGFTVAEEVKKALPAGVPIIFLTASRQPGLRERAMELGAAGFFEKPYDAQALLACIQQALAERLKAEG
jgi:DNA-binding response OmpR family regulator